MLRRTRTTFESCCCDVGAKFADSQGCLARSFLPSNTFADRGSEADHERLEFQSGQSRRRSLYHCLAGSGRVAKEASVGSPYARRTEKLHRCVRRRIHLDGSREGDASRRGVRAQSRLAKTADATDCLAPTMEACAYSP